VAAETEPWALSGQTRPADELAGRLAAEPASESSPEPAAGPSSERGGLLKGRLAQRVDPALERASVSVGFDRKLAKHDLAGSRAHARALLKAGLLSPEEHAALADGLDRLEERLETFVWDPGLEDVHMNVEKALTDLVGPAGAKLHAGRSRNDQVALDERLYLMEAGAAVGRDLRRLRAVLLTRAEQAGPAPMPGYTHLQRAQPILLAHHLAAYAQMLARDQERLNDLRPRLTVFPLGSGALAGTGLPVDPRAAADELGFAVLAPNSLDAVASRDHLLEFLAFGAITMVHLSRLAEDLVLWCSTEFGFASLPDSLTTSSSMMPQKKNPDGAELVRGKAGRTVGNLVALLTTVKGLPMSYNRDLQEDKEPVFDTVETLQMALPLAARMVEELRFDFDRLRAAADDPFAAATDLADHLTRRGLPFRRAHQAVGALVAHCAARGAGLRDVSPQELAAFCPEADPQILERLTLEALLAARANAPGATAPAMVREQLRLAQARLALETQEGRW
jgi:argininosuccinate lyase